MKILIVNDDGIDGIGLRVLASWSRKLGKVTVAAPKFEQSAKSQAIILRRAFKVERSDALADLGIEAYSVDATPADCVRYAVDRIGDDFDLVFSGMNNGINLGHDISYSGTVGASFEANYAGIKSVSFSTVFGNIEKAAAWLDPVWEFMEERSALAHCPLWNVNIPGEPKGILLTEQGRNFYRDHFLEPEPGMFRAQYYVTREAGDAQIDVNFDIDAILEGYCSVTPLTTRKTDYNALEKTRSFEKA